MNLLAWLVWLVIAVIAALVVVPLLILGFLTAGILGIVGLSAAVISAILERKLWLVMVTGMICISALLITLIILTAVH